MEAQFNKEIITIRDLQEIKVTLKAFSESSIDQLQLLRETLSQIVTKEESTIKKIEEIDSLIKFTKKSIEENDKNLKILKDVIEKIENKTVDRNNKDAIIISVEKQKKTIEDLENLMKTMTVFLSENKIGIREIENKINKLVEEISDMSVTVKKTHDTKRNLSWWVDWIYKILLTVGLVYSLFVK